MDLALLIHFHLIDRLLQLAQTNLVLVLQLHVLLFELGDVGQVELLVDDHELLYVVSEEVAEEDALRGKHTIAQLNLIVAVVLDVERLLLVAIEHG